VNVRRLARSRNILAYARVLQRPLDWWRYLQLRTGYRADGGAAAPMPLRLRSLGGRSVLCRPSRDVWTLKYTFLEPFHLPPTALPDDATILDLGSNVGYTVAHFAHLYPRARVIGVEMDARNFELATANVAPWADRVRLLQAAVWSSDGTVSYAGAYDDAYHVTTDGASARQVRAIRIDTILRECDVERVDYLKMDIEGAEAVVLSEPMPWLERVQSLKIEVHPPAEMATLRSRLEEHGFRTWLDDQHAHCICAVREAARSSS